MSYVTAVTNHTASSYFNVADWTRIYGNAQVTNSLAAISLDTAILFNLVTAPTTSTIASVTDFNTLLANIERLRLAVTSVVGTGTTTSIKDDYIAGVSYQAPNYTDVNLWESTVDAIWTYYNGASIEVDKTLTGNLTVTTGNTQMYIDSLDTATYDIDLQGTAHLVII